MNRALLCRANERLMLRCDTIGSSDDVCLDTRVILFISCPPDVSTPRLVSVVSPEGGHPIPYGVRVMVMVMVRVRVMIMVMIMVRTRVYTSEYLYIYIWF